MMGCYILTSMSQFDVIKWFTTRFMSHISVYLISSHLTNSQGIINWLARWLDGKWYLCVSNRMPNRERERERELWVMELLLRKYASRIYRQRTVDLGPAATFFRWLTSWHLKWPTRQKPVIRHSTGVSTTAML